MGPEEALNGVMAGMVQMVLGLLISMWPLWLLMLGLIVLKVSFRLMMLELGARRG